MKLSSLLLLFVLLLGPLAAAIYAEERGAASNLATVPSVRLSTALVSSSPDSPFTFRGPKQYADSADASDNDICYKIRAYIFKQDDAPEFVGSTTCGPRQPHAKNAVWPKVGLVPAK